MNELLQRLMPWRWIVIPAGVLLLAIAVFLAAFNPPPKPNPIANPPATVALLGDAQSLPPLPPTPTTIASTSKSTMTFADCLVNNPFEVPAELLTPLPPAEMPVAETEAEALQAPVELAADEPAISIERFFSEELHEQLFTDLPGKRLSESLAPRPSRPLLADASIFRYRPLPQVDWLEEEPPAPPVASPIVRVFALNYVSRAEVEPMLPELLTPHGKSRFATSELRESQPTKTEVLVIDEPHAVHRVEKYLAQADRPPPHVHVEAHVFQVGLTGSTWQGVNLLPWAAALQGAPANEAAEHFVRFPAGKTTAVRYSLQSTLGAQLLASPEMLVLSGRSASTQVGANAAIAGTVVQGSSAVPYDRGISLQVTPIVAGDGRIGLRIHPEIGDGQINPATGVSDAALDTTVLVADGETLVIGGLIHQRDVEVWTKRRFLGDLPMIGPRFQSRYLVPTRTEVLIVLSPRIVPATIVETATR